jgi:3-deoxy-D-manno-octulosonic-acid transferase
MDSFGEMGSLFSLADLVILGGSFMPKGGHNPLEPAAFGLPIITGQHILKTAPNLPAFAMWGLCLMWQKPMMGLMPR